MRCVIPAIVALLSAAARTRVWFASIANRVLTLLRWHAAGNRQRDVVLPLSQVGTPSTTSELLGSMLEARLLPSVLGCIFDAHAWGILEIDAARIIVLDGSIGSARAPRAFRWAFAAWRRRVGTEQVEDEAMGGLGLQVVIDGLADAVAQNRLLHVSFLATNPGQALHLGGMTLLEMARRISERVDRLKRAA